MATDRWSEQYLSHYHSTCQWVGYIRQHNNGFKVLTQPPNSPDLNPVKHLSDVLDELVRSMEPQLAGLKGSGANVFVPDTTAHLQRSSAVHDLTGQDSVSCKRGTYTILGMWTESYGWLVWPAPCDRQQQTTTSLDLKVFSISLIKR